MRVMNEAIMPGLTGGGRGGPQRRMPLPPGCTTSGLFVGLVEAL